ncbi:MAG TPA: hypothetical protein VJ966_11475, partial [Actinomycetes bacterium]|nr:hypothetical protein [Actinomycetes bacterium]
FDATEIDEILTLRTMALTDDEKREARATDERAAAIIDRVDNMPPELLERLHGAVRYLKEVEGEVEGEADPGPPVDGPPTGRVAGTGEAGERLSTAPPTLPATDPELVPWWDPGADRTVSPETDGVVVAGVNLAKGSRVRLRPGQRRADAQDMFLTGREATVEAVFLDVDGNRHLAVTLDEDPAADLQRWHGRYLYFSPDEVEPR